MTAIDARIDNTSVDNTTIDPEFVISAIDPARLAGIRAAGADEFGNPLTELAAEGWEPLRCCLSRPEPGEAIALICFTPWTAPSPWQEAGPVFVHFGQCDGYAAPGVYPAEFTDTPTMFNTFYADGSRAYEHIRFVTPEQDHVAALREVLSHPEVADVHVRSARAGCFIFDARRAG